MLIDTVVDSLKSKEIVRKTNEFTHPEKPLTTLEVYMTLDFLCECMREIKGSVSHSAFEFQQTSGTELYGCKVHHVRSNNHPNFRVLEVEK